MNEMVTSSSSTVHSPSPDTVSDSSSGYNAPTGLPHPKPKHNIRSQLMQAGFELRSTAFTTRTTQRINSSPNFPIPTNGNVASRISEFERHPGPPNLLQIACALNGVPYKNDQSNSRSSVGPLSPRSTIFRTKPVIYADLAGASTKSYIENANVSSMFQFPIVPSAVTSSAAATAPESATAKAAATAKSTVTTVKSKKLLPTDAMTSDQQLPTISNILII
uniref:HSF_DOMAIN domain-containing protein n=1 Tax=Syphacia muris TaxID=451379 RepID=A0A0N5AIA9_9BILA